ncbi:MAG: beta-ketoacyl-[acyl-carrier-protein] synthase II [Chloroflexi bacterium RBG_19FT_COMBO_47_9]|nr:MAG: beta-ketoacyl-[acyl-carrier-protein] synthase II [Chloroflexi bacterium RBG_19FT_COMBO_47_9]
MDRKRVVITGLGAVTALGSSIPQYWEGLIQGRSGIRRITQFDASQFPCQIAGEIPDFEVEKYIERKEARRMPRSAQIALASAIQAVADANLPETLPEPERSGVVYGTAMGGLDKADEGIQILREQGFGRANPFHIPMSIPNLSGYLIARQFQALGPNCTIVTACATGTQSIGEGAEYIRRNSADLVIVGGVEALIRDFSFGGFCVMRALPVNYNDQPELASRPFDAKREGFIISEGAGTLILESLEHAQARGARIYAEVLGHASSNDGYHIAQPDPDGAGPARAMRWALEDAGIAPYEVDYINAHGTSTPINDPNETRAIKRVFGDHAYKLAVSSTKSMIGHAMGASGTLEAIACVLTIYHSIIPPTINYENPDPECDLDYVPNEARRQEVKTTLSNSFGLGGQNACIILRKYNE